jgi:lysophospholipase L1-like esterase
MPRCLIGFCCLLLLLSPFATAADFPLKDGDMWVMAGDSITAQHLHSNYFEAFCYARYPEMKFAFRNSGVGGHTIPSTLARFDYDIAAWKPTVVSVELGMNDSGGTTTEKFVENMKTMVERIRSIQARPVILSASPVNDGTMLARLAGRNQRLHEYALALKDFCEKEQVPYADQFHRLLDRWGENKPRELLANSLNTLRQLSRDERVAGVEYLRSFLTAQDQIAAKPVSMQGDPVHPGAPGQLMMAAALLSELGAERFVSAAVIDATGKLVEAKGCRIDAIQSVDGKLSFDRLDERLPFPIPDDARVVLPLDPTILELSEYTLRVPGLKSASYSLKINGTMTATLSAKDLEAGVNLTALAPAVQGAAHPIVAQSRAILAAVAAKEGLVGQWRGLSQRAHLADAAAELKQQLAALGKKVEEADAQIRKAATPQKLHFELMPAG